MPERYDLPLDDERTLLREGVVRALKAVPMHFKSTINIEGLSAIDLFAMNTLLGGAIEDQTVATLNEEVTAVVDGISELSAKTDSMVSLPISP